MQMRTFLSRQFSWKMVGAFSDSYRSFMVATVIWKWLHDSRKAC